MTKFTYFTAVLAVLPMLAWGAGNRDGSDADTGMDSGEMADLSEFSFITQGPQGEAPTDYAAPILVDAISDEDAATLAAGGYRAAILMHTSSDWTGAVIDGAQAYFEALGIEVVAVTDAEFDANKQRTDIETALALDPDVIITLVLDPVSGAVALRQAIDQGVNVVLLSNLPQDFMHGTDYVSIVTDDLFNMGRLVAEMINDSLNGQGQVALLYHDAAYYVTNQRDQAVEGVILRDFPGIEVVAKRGIADPQDAETIAAALLTQFPDIDAIYAPWDTIAEGVVAAARGVDSDVAVFTMDLGANTVLDMVQNGNVRGVVADLPYVLGETMAKIGALGILERDAPPFVTVPAISVTVENIAESWRQSLNRELPAEIVAEL